MLTIAQPLPLCHEYSLLSCYSLLSFKFINSYTIRGWYTILNRAKVSTTRKTIVDLCRTIDGGV